MGVDIQTYRAKIGTYRHSCGTDVATCVIVINLSQSLKYIGCVLFIGILLMMAGIEPNPGPKGFDSDRQSDEVTESTDTFAGANIIKSDAKPIDLQNDTTIEVSGLPANIMDEMLIMFFENEKRQGGGKVKNVLIGERDGHALVTFENKKAVETVLKKKPIIFHGREVQVERYVPLKIPSSTLEPSKLFVTGIPSNVKTLKRFFEKEIRQEGGGAVLNVAVNQENQTAVVELEKPEDLQKQQSATREHSKLFVAGLPSNISEETLTMFFENERRQGGGVVLNVTIDTENQTAVVEFENPKAVSTVLQKRPIVIDGKEVECDLFDLQKQQSPTLEHSKLFVAGLPSNVSEETLTMFFENERRQGGGVVLNVTIDTENQTAVVEFENPKAVTTVLRKQPILISGKEVQVDVFAKSSLTQKRNNDETKLKSAGIKTISEVGMEQCGDEKDLHNLCELSNTDVQNIESEAPDIKGVSLLTHQRNNDETNVRNAENKTSSEGGKELSSGENGLHTLCEQRKTVGHRIESEAPDNKAMLLLTQQRNTDETNLKSAGIKTISDVDMKQCGGENDLQNLYEQSNTDGQNIESEAPDIKEINAQTEGGMEQRKHKTDTQVLCEQGSADGQSIESVTPDNEMSGASSLLNQINNDETKVKNAENKTSNEGGKGQYSSTNDLHILCEQRKTKGQRIESEAPDSKGVSLLTHQRNKDETNVKNAENKTPSEGGNEKRSGEIGLHTLSEQRRTKGQRIESEAPDNEGFASQDQAFRHADKAFGTVEGGSKEQLQQSKDERILFDKNSDDGQTRVKESIKFTDIVKKIGLVDKYPGKITVNDVIAINPDDATEYDKQDIPLTDVPWVMLKRLLCAHSDSRDIMTISGNTEEKQTDIDLSVFNLGVEEDKTEALSPLDIFTVVFQCCNLFLKQILVQKLYLCKMAVPFLYKTWKHNCTQEVLSIWPLRSLTIETKLKSTEGNVEINETDVLHFCSKVLTFCRFGRPRYSKSKLLNCLLTSQGSKTFFDIDCPSGMTPRHISHGQIEMFWLPLVGDKRDKFSDAMTFMNIRGDISKHFSSRTYSFIANFTDSIAIITDISSIQENSDVLKDVFSEFPSVILIIASPLSPNEIQCVRNFEKDISNSGKVKNFRILSTHKGTIEQNVVDMVKSLSKHVDDHLKTNHERSINQRLGDPNIYDVKRDEDEPDSQQGKLNAEKLLKTMKSEENHGKWKQALTPVHSKYSIYLGELKKKREREKGFEEGEKIDSEMVDIRKKQIQAVTGTVKEFIYMLIDNQSSYTKLQFTLKWLHFFIEEEKRDILPKLMQENHNAWKKLKIIKGNKGTNEEDVKQQETVILQLEGKIEDASFSVEHFFREIGHIYEAILELNHDASAFELPPTSTIANVVGHLVANGHHLEFIDGESFYMPFKWIQKVIEHVEIITKSCKVMVLSVLGLQSSGKSTLLNTMFGSQFPTRTGRCTRGIHIQLFPTKIAKINKTTSPFDYVLVVDTEGLRSPDLSHVQYEHDNELATVITGLGDITMLNIMGENPSEIRDILQVIVHAFLRLKMTNRALDIRKCCSFIFQNVTDTSASEKMIMGLRRLIQTLDNMTEQSARSEGILDITTFNQVIEFDINSQVWYLKNLWQGNPPMARVNTEYSESVVDIKCNIIKKALNMEDKSYKSLGDIIEQAHCLWKGVLNEDFVFSFRNSIEIRAYMDMDKFVQENLWQLESFTRDKLVENCQIRFANCTCNENLWQVEKNLLHELKELIIDEKIKVEDNIARYFETNKYKDLIIQWKSRQQIRIDTLCQKLELIIRGQVKKNCTKRSLEILTVSSHVKHEEELRLKSMEVANTYKGKQLNQDQIDSLFEDIWNSFIAKIDTTLYCKDSYRKNMKDIFIDCLNDMFQQHLAVLKNLLEESERLKPLSKLSKLAGSFESTGIVMKEDVSRSLLQKGADFLKRHSVTKHVTLQVEDIFKTVDANIKSLCQVNDEITELHVKRLLHTIAESINEMVTGPNTYDFKTPFKVKLCIHISRHAHVIFEKHNENYIRTQGIVIRLEQYKQQQKISFEAHLNNRKTEDIVAQLFSNVVEVYIKERTVANMSNRIMDELHSRLPTVKNRVIIEICKSLAEKKFFYDFVRYLKDPRNYAYSWLLDKAKLLLFCNESGIYYRTANTLVTEAFNSAKRCLEKLKNKQRRTSAKSIDTLVDEFYSIAKEEKLSITFESFRNVKKERFTVQNIQYLTDAVLAYMSEAEDRVVEEFKLKTHDTVVWENDNPIECTIQKIWGCSIKCPFCGEPCAKNQDHDGDVHYCIQHRPSCCIGVRRSATLEGSLTSCNFKINSDITHKCGVFDFVCDQTNKETDKQCSNSPHKYRDYKTFYPDWDISPSSSMHVSSKFWMWFVAEYKTQLCEYYSYKLSDIPASWSEIKEKEAIDSLEKIYSVSTY